MYDAIRVIVELTCQNLTIYELAAHRSIATSGFSPKPVMGYDKIGSLYTEENGTKMHGDTRAAFIAYADPIIEKAFADLKESGK